MAHVHVWTHVHTQCALDIFQCWSFLNITEDFSAILRGGKKKQWMSSVSTKWESIWGWNAFVQPLIKKVQHVFCHVSFCIDLQGNQPRLYFSSRVAKVCYLTAENAYMLLILIYFVQLCALLVSQYEKEKKNYLQLVLYICNSAPAQSEIISPALLLYRTDSNKAP